MELQAEQQDLLEGYLGHFGSLVGDQRTKVTFGETIKGIIGSGSLDCQQIAAHSMVLSVVKDGGQRVIRLATGESTRRSQDVAVWRTIWEQQEHLVCRLSHTERLAEYQDNRGQWVAGDIQSAQRQLRLLGTAQTDGCCWRIGRLQMPRVLCTSFGCIVSVGE